MTIERFCDLTWVSFAVWTLLAHIAVAAGAGLKDLLTATLAVGLLAGLLFVVWSFVGSARSFGSGRPPAPEPDEREAHPQPPDWTVSSSLLVGILGCLAAWLTLAAQRPDEDDSFYLSMAVAAADFPERALLHFDSLHGIPGALIHHPAYRLHSLELLEGALAYLTGIASIYWSHFLVAGVAAFLLPHAYARLLKHLAPQRWKSCLIVVFLIFLTVGAPHHWYSNFGFVRFQQGKAILATVLVPLVTCYAIEFMASPRWSRWLRLAACQIAAVGLSATGLWLAPAVAGLGILTGFRPRVHGPKILLVGLLASAYPLATALELRSDLAKRAEPALILGAPGAAEVRGDQFDSSESRALETQAREAPPRELAKQKRGKRRPTEQNPEPLWARARTLVLGTGLLPWVVGAASLLAWLLATEPLGRRFSVVYPLGFLALFNPLTDDLVAQSLTGSAVYWRVFWVLPAPALLALLLTAPLTLLRPSSGEATSRRATRVAMTAVLVAAFSLLVPKFWVLDEQNADAVLGLIRLDVPSEYSYAKALVELVPAGATVLAPLEITPWIVTLHRHPNPLITRELYKPILRRQVGAAETADRMALSALVSSPRNGPSPIEPLLAGIERYDLQAICVNREIRWRSELREALEAHGFDSGFEDARYQIWVRQ